MAQQSIIKYCSNNNNNNNKFALSPISNCSEDCRFQLASLNNTDYGLSSRDVAERRLTVDGTVIAEKQLLNC